jgi:hypothetical protein
MLPNDPTDTPANCTSTTHLTRESTIQVDELNSANEVRLKVKLHETGQTCEFDGEVVERETRGPWTTGIRVSFSDDCGESEPVEKMAHLYLVHTRSGSIGNKSCAKRLREKAKGRDVFNAHPEACGRLSEQGRKRHVIYWRISSESNGAAQMTIPPGDGQGSGSDDPPQ